MPLREPHGSSEWFACSCAEHLKANETKFSATLVDIRESNLSDAGSIPAISTFSPHSGAFFYFFLKLWEVEGAKVYRLGPHQQESWVQGELRRKIIWGRAISPCRGW